MFDSGKMAHDRSRPDRDRLSGIASRHARWGSLTEDEMAAGAAELREVADDRADLLAEVAGLAIGSAVARGQDYEARGQAVAELCIAAGADEARVPAWIEEGRRRAEERRRPPFSQPRRTPPRP
jgi:hypothetical protein